MIKPRKVLPEIHYCHDCKTETSIESRISVEIERGESISRLACSECGGTAIYKIVGVGMIENYFKYLADGGDLNPVAWENRLKELEEEARDNG